MCIVAGYICFDFASVEKKGHLFANPVGRPYPGRVGELADEGGRIFDCGAIGKRVVVEPGKIYIRPLCIGRLYFVAGSYDKFVGVAVSFPSRFVVGIQVE